MNQKLQRQWHLLAYFFVAYVLISSSYRILKAVTIFDLAILKSFLLWPSLVLLCAIFLFSLWLYQKSGKEWKMYMQDKKFVRLFFFVGFGLAIVLAVITDYVI
ncbi:MAG: hypothetical protein ACLUDH_11535 [Faecalispora sporosphaeroides]|jgi:hypothetical protein|uniref:Uncharacterized protein n=1 Tax=Faecalispora sporosphaeroides TaxID=1549 RepID=A0A928Q641_9FIRM|nr:hypothetical protein [Faecalispora sporosphaeroides]MBE6834465.1 hypothetical protein [Faecalispora sporosphaeroides]